MSRLRVLYHLVRADLLERTRRYSFLVILAATLYLGYAFTTGQIVLRLDRYRGLYNSAWVGVLAAIIATFFLSLVGFYLVKNALERDRRTGVGQIIAATPVSKLSYVMGKVLSNLALFVVIGSILVIAAIAMQMIRGEDPRIRVWPLLSPFVLILLPTMTVVSSVAVLFEALPWLQGGLGNVAYFLAWISFITFAYTHPGPLLDLLGLSLLEGAFGSAAGVMGLDYDGGLSIEMVNLQWVQTVRWQGILWTPQEVWSRLYWVGVALALALLAAAVFDRFDPARHALRGYRIPFQGLRQSLIAWWRNHLLSEAAPLVARKTSADTRLTPLRASPQAAWFPRVLWAELRLMLKGQRWWWYAVAAGLIVGGLFASGRDVRQTWLPLAWIWPVLVWSAMGVREVYHRTEQLVFSVPHPLLRQLPATWLAGVVVALLTGSGVAARLVLCGDWEALQACAIGALFVPTLALALGVWSGSSKPFEAVYVVLWYLGPMNHILALDYIGSWNGSLAAGVPRYYLGLTVLLCGLAVVGRRRQLGMHSGGLWLQSRVGRSIRPAGEFGGGNRGVSR